jgi:hypothetical protein
MNVYGAASDGVYTFKKYVQKQTEDATALATLPPFPETQAELTERVLKLDRAKQNIDFATGVVEQILKNVTGLQP